MGHIDTEYCNIGDQAIQKALPLLQTIGTVQLIESGTEITNQLQLSGVDAMIFVSQGKLFCIEIKGSKKTYDKIHIETVQDTRTDSPGWIYNIKSDFLLWVYIDTEVGYMLRVCPLKDWFDLNEKTYKRVEHSKPSGACSLGILVKWERLYYDLGSNNFFKFNLRNNWNRGIETLGLLN